LTRQPRTACAGQSIFKDEVLAGTEKAEHPAEEMSERRDHSKNLTGTVQIQRCAKLFILQVYDDLARHRISQAMTLPFLAMPCSQTPPESPATIAFAVVYCCLQDIRPYRPPDLSHEAQSLHLRYGLDIVLSTLNSCRHLSPRLDSRWGGSSLSGAGFHPLEAPGLAWRTEYMLNIPANADTKERGIQNHFSLVVPEIKAAVAKLKADGLQTTDAPEISRDGKWSFDIYDSDFTRVEFMEFKPVKEPCCTPYTAEHSKP
jgi:hypothetical protein